MPRSLRITHKLSLAALLFIAPIAFALWLVVSEQNIAIRFATHEVAGARYLRGVNGVQAQAAVATLDGGRPPASAATALRASERDHGALLETAAPAAAAAGALEAPADAATLVAVRAKLRDLIARIGDRSNLILDNVLETYYLTDVVLNRLPEVLDRLADLSVAAHQPMADAAARAQFLVGVGLLSAALDGADGSITSAEQDNGDGALKRSLDGPYQPLHVGLAAFLAALQQPGANLPDAHELIARTAAFGDLATGELDRLLSARVGGLHRAQLRAVSVTALLFVLCVAGVLLLARRMVIRPIVGVTEATRRLAANDLDTPVPDSRSGDEVGDLCRSLLVFKQALRDNRALEAAQVRETVAQRDRQDTMQALARDFNIVVSGRLATVAAAIQQLRATADALSGAAGRTSERSGEVQQQARVATENAETVAAATEQLASSSREIAGQIQRSSNATRSVAEQAQQACRLVDELSQVVLGTSELLQLIDRIAAQTNLLALNATIEAARAGEAGRGFAVVAQEVKALAAQTLKATGEVAARIAAMTEAANRVSGTVGEIAELIIKVDGSSAAIAAAVTEQGAATDEISRNVHEAARCTSGVSTDIGGVREDAAQTQDASAQLRMSAGDLAAQARQLHEEIEQFLASTAKASDRRAALRFVADLPVTLALSHGGLIEARLTNISEAGAAMRADARLTAGDEVQLNGLADSPIASRIISCRDGAVRVQFRHDKATQSLVQGAIAARFAGTEAQAA